MPQRCVRILTQHSSNGAGLDVDISLYRDIFESCGWSVVCKSHEDDIAGEEPVDINLFLEHIRSEWMPLASQNWFMVNQEIGHSTRCYSRLDLVIAKTRHAQGIMEYIRDYNGYNYEVLYTCHSSKNRGRDTVPARHEVYCLHVPGKSANKNTKPLLDAWWRHPEWPRLVVVGRPRQLVYLPRYTGLDNVDILMERVPDEDLDTLYAHADLHICTSEAEGWGHYLNEARSTGGVCMVTNGEPMNELLDHQSAIMVRPHSVSSRNSLSCGLYGSRAYKVSIAGIEEAMAMWQQLSPDARRAMGTASRQRYLYDTAYFTETLKHRVETYAIVQHRNGVPRWERSVTPLVAAQMAVIIVIVGLLTWGLISVHRGKISAT